MCGVWHIGYLNAALDRLCELLFEYVPKFWAKHVGVARSHEVGRGKYEGHHPNQDRVVWLDQPDRLMSGPRAAPAALCDGRPVAGLSGVPVRAGDPAAWTLCLASANHARAPARTPQASTSRWSARPRWRYPAAAARQTTATPRCGWLAYWSPVRLEPAMTVGHSVGLRGGIGPARFPPGRRRPRPTSAGSAAHPEGVVGRQVTG